MTTLATPAPCYRILRGRDSRGAVWFDVETLDADGRRAIVATFDYRDDARDLVRRLELHAARHAAAVRSLAEARDTAARLQADRRAIADAGGPLAWIGFRDCGAYCSRLVTYNRTRAAARLRAARAALRNF